MTDSATTTRKCPYKLDDSVSKLPLVGPAYGEKLARLNILTIRDLLYHFPSYYQDTRDISSIEELKSEGEGTIHASIRTIGNTRTRSRKWLTKAVLEDSSGSISAVWFNQPYLSKTMKPGMMFTFHGKTSSKWGSVSLMSPQYEKVGGLYDDPADTQKDTTHLGRLTPIYPETKGLSSRWIRYILKPILQQVKVREILPKDIIKKEKLLGIEKAIKDVLKVEKN